MSTLTWFDSSELGAPDLNNANGSLTSVLRACLVTGFNAKTVASISVSNGVATVNCTGHGYTTTYRKLVTISGCDQAGLNGEQQPTSVTTDTFTFATTVPNGTYGGTISAKRTPLGWSELYSSATRSIFKRNDLDATAAMLLVADDSTTGSYSVATVSMIESATSISTYTNAYPGLETSRSYWMKGAATTTTKGWAIIGDGKRFYALLPPFSDTYNIGFNTYFFGDMINIKANDVYGTFLLGGVSSALGSALSGSINSTLTDKSAIDGTYFMRNYSGSVVGVKSSLIGMPITSSTNYDNPVSNDTYLVGPYMITDAESIRSFTNLYITSTNTPYSKLEIVNPIGTSDNFIAFRNATSSNTNCTLAIKLEGW